MNVVGARAHDYGRGTAKQLFETIAVDGWKAIQLAFPKAIEGVTRWEDVTPGCVQEVKTALNETGLAVPVLGVYVEPSYVEETARKQQMAIFASQFSVAKELSAGCIGTETTSMTKQPGETRRDAMRSLTRSIAEIMPKAEEMGVTVGVEPVFHHALATPELTRQLLADIASPFLRVIYDPANLFAPELASEQYKIWDGAMEAFGDKIAAVHIKGTHWIGKERQKVLLRDSDIDYAYILKQVRSLFYEPCILREEAVPACAVEERTYLQNLLG